MFDQRLEEARVEGFPGKRGYEQNAKLAVLDNDVRELVMALKPFREQQSLYQGTQIWLDDGDRAKYGLHAAGNSVRRGAEVEAEEDSGRISESDWDTRNLGFVS
eukprot:745686-Hanusia_phi.AAC.4